MVSVWILALAAVTNLVPVSTMTETNRALVSPVLEHYTLRREYAARTFRGRREHFEFLMDNMAACSVLSEALGLIRYRTVDDGAGRILADDRAGAKGFLQQVYCGEGERIYYVEGTQRGAFQARGRGVVVVTFKATQPDTIEYAGKMLVKIDNSVLAALAKVFFAFVKGSVDRHFDHVMAQPIHLSTLALEDPGLLRRCIEAMPGEDYRLLAPFHESLAR